MKTLTLLSVCTFLAGMLFSTAGCARSEDTSNAPPEEKTPQKSNVQTTIDGVTGKTAIEAGKKAEEKLGTINVQREEDIKALESF